MCKLMSAVRAPWGNAAQAASLPWKWVEGRGDGVVVSAGRGEGGLLLCSAFRRLCCTASTRSVPSPLPARTQPQVSPAHLANGWRKRYRPLACSCR